MARNNFNSECHHWIEIRYNMIGQSGIRYLNIHLYNFIKCVSRLLILLYIVAKKKYIDFVNLTSRQCNTVNNQVYTTTNDGERNLMLVKFDSRIRKDIQSSQGQKFKLQFTAEGGKCFRALTSTGTLF